MCAKLGKVERRLGRLYSTVQNLSEKPDETGCSLPISLGQDGKKLLRYQPVPKVTHKGKTTLTDVKKVATLHAKDDGSSR